MGKSISEVGDGMDGKFHQSMWMQRFCGDSTNGDVADAESLAGSLTGGVL